MLKNNNIKLVIKTILVLLITWFFHLDTLYIFITFIFFLPIHLQTSLIFLASVYQIYTGVYSLFFPIIFTFNLIIESLDAKWVVLLAFESLIFVIYKDQMGNILSEDVYVNYFITYLIMSALVLISNFLNKKTINFSKTIDDIKKSFILFFRKDYSEFLIELHGENIKKVYFYLFFCFSVYLLFQKRHQEFLFFQDYFLTNQLLEYFKNSGIYIIPIILIYFYIALRMILNPKIENKKLLIIPIFLISYQLSNKIFDTTTYKLRNMVKILSVSPSESREPWVDVVVKGVNFGTSPEKYKLTINRIEQRVIKWSDKEIIFRTNPTSTPRGSLFIQMEGKSISNPIEFKYLFNN